VCQNGDRWALGVGVLMGARLDGCEESQWVTPNVGLIVWDGNQSGLESISAVVIHNVGKGLG